MVRRELITDEGSSIQEIHGRVWGHHRHRTDSGNRASQRLPLGESQAPNKKMSKASECREGTAP